jgi:tetratricopeptide (TPR) repeat protein
LGEPAVARGGLERAAEALPENTDIRDQLRILYERIGAHRELADILRRDMETIEEEDARVAVLQKVGHLLLSEGDAEAALEPLNQAYELKAEDDVTTALLVDAYTALYRLEEATDMLNKAIDAHKRRRSPELALLQLRMARLAELSEDQGAQLQWLSLAMDTDRKNGDIAAELADLAMAVGEYDTAMKALRNITMMEEPGAMSRAMAFLRQAQIAHARDDVRRAQHWARKAKSLDPDLAEAEQFLQEIGG